VPSKKKAKPTQGNVARSTANAGNSLKSSVKKKPRGDPNAVKPYQFKPGQSGNPSGRARDQLSDALRSRLAVLIPNDKERRDWAAATMQSLVNEGVRGNINAIALMFDRLEGKPMQAHEVSGPGGGAIPLTSMTPEENEKRIAELQAKHGGFKE
jgi:hypothetical protein